MNFSVLTCTTDVDVVTTSVCQKTGKKSSLPRGVIIGTLSNRNKLSTLPELIILNDMLLATYLQMAFSFTTIRQKLDLNSYESDLVLGLKGHTSIAAKPMSFRVVEWPYQESYETLLTAVYLK